VFFLVKFVLQIVKCKWNATKCGSPQPLPCVQE